MSLFDVVSRLEGGIILVYLTKFAHESTWLLSCTKLWTDIAASRLPYRVLLQVLITINMSLPSVSFCLILTQIVSDMLPLSVLHVLPQQVSPIICLITVLS